MVRAVTWNLFQNLNCIVYPHMYPLSKICTHTFLYQVRPRILYSQNEILYQQNVMWIVICKI